jgi:hypothetical protein
MKAHPSISNERKRQHIPIYDFTCPQGHTFEALAKTSDQAAPCREPGCEETASRDAIPRPRELAGLKKKLGDFANLSSLRFNFNYRED